MRVCRQCDCRCGGACWPAASAPRILSFIEELRRVEPRARVLDNRIFVEDGAVFTSAGVTAGLDLALYVIGQQLGPRVASEVAREPGGVFAPLAAQTRRCRRGSVTATICIPRSIGCRMRWCAIRLRAGPPRSCPQLLVRVRATSRGSSPSTRIAHLWITCSSSASPSRKSSSRRASWIWSGWPRSPDFGRRSTCGGSGRVGSPSRRAHSESANGQRLSTLLCARAVQ